SADRPFEFVLLDSPYLAITPDRDAFAGHFAAAGGQSVVSFPNLGGDAVLVVPGPAGPASAYGHLAAFIRHAPEAQQHELWQLVGRTMERRLGTSPVWLSRTCSQATPAPAVLNQTGDVPSRRSIELAG